MSAEIKPPVVPELKSDAAVEEPLVLLELIQRMKVRDAMTSNLVTASRSTSVTDVLELMRTSRISGIPVEEDGRLFGIVSRGDVIRTLMAGAVNEPCSRHMTSKLVVLEDDMPLSFALRYFDRYHYGRFPVLNRDRRLVGIVCQRDINRVLLVELARELHRLESASVRQANEDGVGSLYLLREFPICKYDFENAGKAANQIKQVLQEKKIPAKIIRRIAVATYELEINLCAHSDGGVLSWQLSNGRAEVIARDAGPGIEDVEWACRDGNSTANEWIRSLGFGAGMGLVNVKRVSDEFEITSKKGSGTTVKSVINIEGMPS